MQKKAPSSRLTPKQNKVYEFISQFLDTQQYPPTYADIANAFNFKSEGTVRTYLEQLEQKGYINRSGKARGIQLNRPFSQSQIPILGEIAAGIPQLASETPMGYIENLPSLQQHPKKFGLKIKGDSMINAGILPGDIAIIQQGQSPKNNDTIAILIDDEATLKRIQFNTDETFSLHSENPKYSPMTIQKNQVQTQCLGILKGIIRSL